MKRLVIFVITTSILLSLAGCGGKSDIVDTTAETEMNETVTTQEPVETQTPEPTSTPTSTINYSWENHTCTWEDQDGYVIEEYYSFVDSWVDCNDKDTVKKICDEIGIKNLPPTDAGFDFYGNLIKENNPHMAYLFGTVQCKNVTQGWDITDNNAKDVVFHVRLLDSKEIKSPTGALDSSAIMHVFYSNETIDMIHSGLNGFGHYGYSIGIGLKLNKNTSAKLPFCIKVYSPINPNHPQGDKWYEQLKITAGNRVGYQDGDPDFIFQPKATTPSAELEGN